MGNRVTEVVVDTLIGLGCLTGAWLAFCILFRMVFYRKSVTYKGKHVVVVGGSEGICKEIARSFAHKGSKITIMARTVSKLQEASKDISESTKTKDDKVTCSYVSIDVTKSDTIGKAFDEAIKKSGPIDVVVLGAGKAYPDYILTQDIELYERSIDLNYLGAVRCVKELLPRFISDIKSRISSQKQICFVGSACSVIGFLGYGSYTPSKFALKGFSDVLRNELSGTKISVSFAFPPDTDTPGFEEENKTKPKENLEMFPPEVYSAKAVASAVIDGLSRKEYLLFSPDLGQNILINTLSGITTRNRWAPFFIAISPLAHLIFMILKWNIDSVATKYGKQLISSEEKVKKT